MWKLENTRCDGTDLSAFVSSSLCRDSWYCHQGLWGDINLFSRGHASVITIGNDLLKNTNYSDSSKFFTC